MTLGPLAFASPWLLLGLAALPAIWWLLRATPPRPRVVHFAPTHLLEGLRSKDQTPAKTPWWLALIRMLAAALVISALAEPILNPPSEAATSGDGSLVIVVDNGWEAAAHWEVRKATLSRLIAEAQAAARPTLVVATAADAKRAGTIFRSAGEARDQAGVIVPRPWAPDRDGLLKQLQAALAGPGQGDSASAGDIDIVWLASALDHGSGAAFASGLAGLARGRGRLTVVSFRDGDRPIGLRVLPAVRGQLKAEVVSLAGPERTGTVLGLNGKGQRLAGAAFTLPAGADHTEISLDLPLEISKQISRFEISGQRSAGAVGLLDAKGRWHRVGLISGSGREQAQPLLSPIYYLERALTPYADLIKAGESNMDVALNEILNAEVSTLALANIGKLVGQSARWITEWVNKGGVLIRFAGPRLEKAGDNLLPVPLRFGGRTLGGALSWSEPQALAPFDEASLFAGLDVPGDIRIRRQVLADPARLGQGVEIWARLKDGTPLVTARRLGSGWTVLFHVTANSDWSNLPHSGLFVEMLRRLLTISGGPIGGGGAASDTATNGAGAALSNAAASGPKVLAPLQTLDGFGTLEEPPVSAQPLTRDGLARAEPSARHPPGFYGSADGAFSLNVISPTSELRALPALPAGVRRANYGSQSARPLKSWLLLAALALIFVDVLAVLAIQAAGFTGHRRTATVATLLFALAFASGIRATDVRAGERADPAGDAFAMKAALSTRLAYALTGEGETDRASRLGLEGLGRILATRTAIEPSEPMGVDITRDELAFFAIIYWPVRENAKPLDDKTLARIDAYMKQGGMILFDTRDYGRTIPTPGGGFGPGSEALQRLIGRLDVPRLEPVPPGHVLTKSFYLLSSFPGRWDGGTLWVEASDDVAEGDQRAPRQTDGVSSILITSNDFASAWALDEGNRPIFPVVPGGEIQREMAFRTGVNIVMYALTGNYKADQVHVPALLERLGQ